MVADKPLVHVGGDEAGARAPQASHAEQVRHVFGGVGGVPGTKVERSYPRQRWSIATRLQSDRGSPQRSRAGVPEEYGPRIVLRLRGPLCT